MSTPSPTTTLPAALRRYLTAIADGDPDEAIRHTSHDVESALPPSPAEPETAPRRRISGRPYLRDALASAYGDSGLTVLLAAGGGDRWFVEGQLDADPAETVVASFTVDGEAITRQLAFRCPLVARPPAPRAPSGGHDGLHAVERYFEHLERAEMSAAVECFSPDTLYSHPPYKHAPEEGRAEFRGRAELLAGFERRGYRTVHHELLASAQLGPHVLVEGSTDDAPGGGSFISSVTLDPEGRIERYVALFTQPRVPFDYGTTTAFVSE